MFGKKDDELIVLRKVWWKASQDYLDMYDQGKTVEELDEAYNRVSRTWDLYQKAEERNDKKSFSKDALLGAGVSLGGILMIIFAEKFGEMILTSKAMSFIKKH
jgi:hypothetical protein